jgi:hypothetical protein
VPPTAAGSRVKNVNDEVKSDTGRSMSCVAPGASETTHGGPLASAYFGFT